MSTKAEELKTRLKASLENANRILQLKARIEDDMSSVLDMLTELTSESIDYIITENNSSDHRYKDCKKLVRVKKKSSIDYSSNFILFGFSINESTGYPLILETEKEYVDCSDLNEMEENIVTIIESKSIDIMKLISEEDVFIDDIPF